MKPRLLDAQQFAACFATPMRDVTANSEAAVDIWPYVDALDLEALGLAHLNVVRHVYRDGQARYDQVLIGTARFNTLLVIVVDRAEKCVHGHHLLDLNAEFGENGGHLRIVE